MLKGRDEKKVIAAKWEIFFDCPYETHRFRNAFPEPRKVTDWVREVRSCSHQFISQLKLADYNAVPTSSFECNSIARVLMQTIGHTGLHIGKIQLLRRLMPDENKS
jgi:hypothetical protein